MATLNDYLDWRGDIPFSALPPCEVDCLIFSIIAYIKLEDIVSPEHAGGITLSDAVKAFFEKYTAPEERRLGLFIHPEFVDMFERVSVFPRFSDIVLHGYTNEVSEEREMQFAAVTADLPDTDISVVCFRGTDDNIVGWKEDFGLSFMDEVPSQRKAKEYLAAVAASSESRLYLTGHSKGGHLAVWSAVHSHQKVRDRIVRIYSNDGPGFLPTVIESAEYAELSDRITTLVPQSSLVGLLLDNDRSFQVIKSRKSGILQHNPFLWELMGARFIRMEQLSDEGVKNDTVIRARIADMTPEERRKFTELLFDLISSTGAKTLSELNESKLKSVQAVLKAVSGFDKGTKETAGMLVSKLFDVDIKLFPIFSDVAAAVKKGKNAERETELIEAEENENESNDQEEF